VSVSAFWTSDEEVPIGCGMTHTRSETSTVTVWNNGNAWRIGVPHTSHGSALDDVLREACAGPCWTAARAEAWALLLSARIDANGIAAIGEAVAAAELDGYELTPLFAALALAAPSAVAALFPSVLPDCVLVLCGADAEAAALRGLQSCRTEHRFAATNALRALAQSGVKLSPGPIEVAAASEGDADVREALAELQTLARGRRSPRRARQ
jgi:hypothetical protein